MPSANAVLHGTLVANAVFTATLTAESGSVEVINRSGTDEIYWTVLSSGEVPADPTIGGADCFVTPASISSYVAPAGEKSVTVKLISASVQKFSVIVGGEL